MLAGNSVIFGDRFQRKSRLIIDRTRFDQRMSRFGWSWDVCHDDVGPFPLRS